MLQKSISDKKTEVFSLINVSNNIITKTLNNKRFIKVYRKRVLFSFAFSRVKAKIKAYLVFVHEYF